MKDKNGIFFNYVTYACEDDNILIPNSNASIPRDNIGLIIILIDLLISLLFAIFIVLTEY